MWGCEHGKSFESCFECIKAQRDHCLKELNTLRRIAEELEDERDNAVIKERKACAELAWKMQMESFGGGTAIGNAIAERRE